MRQGMTRHGTGVYVALTRVGIVTLLSATAGCHGPDERARQATDGATESPHIVFLDTADPVPRFDAYVTWKDRRESVVYPLFYWNGEPVGRGRVGFSQILERMRLLRRGSTVLFYPEWLGCRQIPNSPFLNIAFPWQGQHTALEETAQTCGLHVVCSPRDHLNRICPEILGAPPESAPAEDARRFPIPKETGGTAIGGETQPATDCSHER